MQPLARVASRRAIAVREHLVAILSLLTKARKRSALSRFQPEGSLMRRSILCGALLSAVFVSHDQPLQAAPLEVSWLTQYGGESLQTVNLPTAPRMIANISNSLMTAAPSYLDDAIYLQRRAISPVITRSTTASVKRRKNGCVRIE